MARKKRGVNYVYIEILKKNPVAYKRYLIFRSNKFWYSHLSWSTNGENTTKNITSEEEDE